MTQAQNLATGETKDFDALTAPEYAVAYGYYEERNMLSWFFDSVHDAAANMQPVPTWMEQAPIIYGARSVSCGDWAALLED